MNNKMLVIGFGIIALVAIALFVSFHSVTEARAQPIPVSGAQSQRQAEEFLHASNAYPLPQQVAGLNNVPASSTNNPAYLNMPGYAGLVNSIHESGNTTNPDYLQLRQEWEFLRNSVK